MTNLAVYLKLSSRYGPDVLHDFVETLPDSERCALYVALVHAGSDKLVKALWYNYSEQHMVQDIDECMTQR